MQLILLEKIHHLGNLGDQVKVKPGYGRNFLIPQRKAVPATPDNIARFESRRAELEKAMAASVAAAQSRAASMTELVLEIRAKASDEGKLYGSVGVREIVEALKAKGFEAAKKEILLTQGVIRQTGEYSIQLNLHSDVRVEVKLQVLPESSY